MRTYTLRDWALRLADRALTEIQLQWSPAYDGREDARTEQHVRGNKAWMRYMCCIARHKELANVVRGRGWR